MREIWEIRPGPPDRRGVGFDYAARMSRRLRRLTLGLALGLCSTGALGCVNGTNKIVRTAVPAGIEETLRALADPVNQELMQRIANDPQLQKAAHDFTAAMTGGALDGLTGDERHKQLRAVSDAYIQSVSAAVGRALNEEISPAVTKTVESLVGGAVASAVSADNKRLTASFIDGVTRSAITAFTQSTAQGLRDDLGPALGKVIADDLGPALRKVIAEDLGPGVHAMIRDELKPAMAELFDEQARLAIGGVVRGVTKDIVLGVNDGMTELGLSLSPKKDGGGLGIFGWMAVVLGLVVAILMILLVRTILTRRSLEQERARSERMLLNVLRTIQYTDTDDPSRPPDLDALIARARMNDSDPDPRSEGWIINLLAQARVPDKAARASRPAPAPLSEPRKR
jgi:heme exporter protein D